MWVSLCHLCWGDTLQAGQGQAGLRSSHPTRNSRSLSSDQACSWIFCYSGRWPQNEDFSHSFSLLCPWKLRRNPLDHIFFFLQSVHLQPWCNFLPTFLCSPVVLVAGAQMDLPEIREYFSRSPWFVIAGLDLLLIIFFSKIFFFKGQSDLKLSSAGFDHSFVIPLHLSDKTRCRFPLLSGSGNYYIFKFC